MEGGDSLLESIFEEPAFGGADETLGDDDDEIQEEQKEDIEMLDAETLDAAAAPGESSEGGATRAGGDYGSNGEKRKGSKGRKKKRRRRKGGGGGDSGAASSIADMNRFVIQTCRHLKEHKSYLIWNAIGCLGISAVKDLVKEVDAIQKCGGQKTADGRRFRSGGGILWNILKTREPKAYKEIMAKAKEFEKQFWVSKSKMRSNKDGAPSVPDEAAEIWNSSENGANVQDKLESSDPNPQRKNVVDRMRVPVSYEDLLEEGEIHE
ncbi:hypothetical protein Cni_G07297 [Canna indica]|uniref:Phosphorylated adapter RNA export protein n=1 Tax=Canna indica TaxID=4628 RepID=A0AAQ3K3I8_9LILI|nr:hypothetical protein Cni_G07297 [Canna indica]